MLELNAKSIEEVEATIRVVETNYVVLYGWSQLTRDKACSEASNITSKRKDDLRS